MVFQKAMFSILHDRPPPCRFLFFSPVVTGSSASAPSATRFATGVRTAGPSPASAHSAAPSRDTLSALHISAVASDAYGAQC